MTKLKKILAKVLSGSKNITFEDFVQLVEGFGFRLACVNGSHHIFVHDSVKELVNLQNVNGQVKPYQVKQVMELIERYNLELEKQK
jgi:predicted RNA binding protein YcfA (HicA-like mRNA interferase family)